MDQIDNIKKTVKAFQKYYSLTNKSLDILDQNKNVYLDVVFKKIPINRDSFCKLIGPLPKPVNFLNEITICLFVRDPNPSKKLKDRELDLNTTKDHYLKILEEAQLPKEVLNNLTILPMRELLTEYKTYQARNKLAASFDIFLVDWKLFNNKFKLLKNFLGSAFYKRQKKIPIPIKLNEEDVKKNFLKALSSTNFFISGHGISSTILIGRVDYDTVDLAKNLKFVINKLNKNYPDLVSILRICGSKSDGFAFFADFRKNTMEEFIDKFPLTKRKKNKLKIDKQFKGIASDEEISDIELETKDGKYEITRKRVRYEDISIF